MGLFYLDYTTSGVNEDEMTQSQKKHTYIPILKIILQLHGKVFITMGEKRLMGLQKHP